MQARIAVPRAGAQSDGDPIDREPARERWNRRFAAAGFEAFPDDPAQWLTEHDALVRTLAPGRALDVGCGDGRNALHLARLGFEVDALDVSDFAIERLRAAAARRGLAIDARLCDLEREPLPAAAYDVVVDFNYLQRDLLPALAGALAPGGLLVFETFARAHIDELGGRIDPAYVLGPNELLRAFDGLLVEHYREGVVDRRGAKRGLARLVARRPGAAAVS